MAAHIARTAGFASSMAVGEDWADAAKSCLSGLDVPVGANLGFLYVSDRLGDQLGSVLTLFRGVTGVDQWVGTVGLGVCGAGAEVFDRPAIAAMVGSFPEGAFRCFPGLTGDLGPMREAAGGWLDRHSPLLGLVHADPMTPDMPGLMARLSEATGAFLVGGLTAARGEAASVAGRMAPEGLSGVLFDAAVPVLTGMTQGCAPIGPVRSITRAADGIIQEIDGRPALEVLRQDVGEGPARDLRQLAGRVFAGFPIKGSDTGDYQVRALVGIDPGRGWIAAAEPAETGRPLLFCQRDAATALADMERMLVQIVRRLDGRRPRGAVYTTCVARGPNLFDGDGLETSLIRAALGDVPLAGFFANGEISHGRLHTHTGVLTLFL